MTDPAYDVATPVDELGVDVVVQHNPGLMTLEGTNTWLVRDPGTGRTTIVDPGQADHAPEAAEYGGSPAEADAEAHLHAVLAAAGEIDTVLITHRHHDHHGLADAVYAATDAPVRATDPDLCRRGEPLTDGERLGRLRVVATPGHTADSTSFVLLDGAGRARAVLTGDMVLGHGTTVVAHPDGVLGPYLASLGVLGALGDLPVLPGHGPVLPSIAAVTRFYLDHRRERLGQVRSALAELGADASARAVVELVYADVDEALWPAAERSVEAQLAYLRD